jgi:cytochrome c peroxidase
MTHTPLYTKKDILVRYMLLIILFFISYLYATEPISPIPQAIAYDKRKAELGKKLFFDPILSKDGTVACATCHILSEGGDDNRAFSPGIDGQKGCRNSPTVFNAVFNYTQFWDSRAKDLKAQAAGPIENPVEMGNNFENLIKVLNKSPYKEEFKKIYKKGITKESITDAIAEFEKALITPNCAFDRYLRGKKDAISEKQKEGYELFKSKGCVSCHHGINIGGNLSNRFGIFGDISSNDLGRYDITKKEKDRYFFKVPSLRNIALTSPYFHDGRTESLSVAVDLMAKVQLGKKLKSDEIEKIVSFLESLNGEMPKIMKSSEAGE